MKKVLTFMFACVLCFSFFGCGDKDEMSDAERKYQQAVEAAAQAEKVADMKEKEYEDLKNRLDNLDRLYKELDSAK